MSVLFSLFCPKLVCLTLTRASLTLSRLESSKLSPFCLNSALDTWIQARRYSAKHAGRANIKHAATRKPEHTYTSPVGHSDERRTGRAFGNVTLYRCTIRDAHRRNNGAEMKSDYQHNRQNTIQDGAHARVREKLQRLFWPSDRPPRKSTVSTYIPKYLQIALRQLHQESKS